MTAISTRPYIEQRNGGYYIINTRIALDSVVYVFRQGLSPESIVQSYPLLTLEQVYGAISFYLSNRSEIDAYLADEEVRLAAMTKSFQAEAPELHEKLSAARQLSSR